MKCRLRCFFHLCTHAKAILATNDSFKVLNDKMTSLVMATQVSYTNGMHHRIPSLARYYAAKYYTSVFINFDYSDNFSLPFWVNCTKLVVRIRNQALNLVDRGLVHMTETVIPGSQKLIDEKLADNMCGMAIIEI